MPRRARHVCGLVAQRKQAPILESSGHPPDCGPATRQRPLPGHRVARLSVGDRGGGAEEFLKATDWIMGRYPHRLPSAGAESHPAGSMGNARAAPVCCDCGKPETGETLISDRQVGHGGGQEPAADGERCFRVSVGSGAVQGYSGSQIVGRPILSTLHQAASAQPPENLAGAANQASDMVSCGNQRRTIQKPLIQPPTEPCRLVTGFE